MTQTPSPEINITQIVQRQLSDDPTIALPTIGPNVGPEKNKQITMGIAILRWASVKQSLVMPPMTATGETPKNPANNRPMTIVCIFVPSAGISARKEEIAMPPIKGHLRPNFSESGPNVRNPKIYPFGEVR